MILGIPFAYHRGVAFESVFEGYLVNMLFFVLFGFPSHLVAETQEPHLGNLPFSPCMYSVFGGLLQGVWRWTFPACGTTLDPNDTAYVLVSLFPLCLYLRSIRRGVVEEACRGCGHLSAPLRQSCKQDREAAFWGSEQFCYPASDESWWYWERLQVAPRWHARLHPILLSRIRLTSRRYLTLTDISSDYNVSSEGGRLELWQAAIDLSLANPITGVGVNCYPLGALSC